MICRRAQLLRWRASPHSTPGSGERARAGPLATFRDSVQLFTPFCTEQLWGVCARRAPVPMRPAPLGAPWGGMCAQGLLRCAALCCGALHRAAPGGPAAGLDPPARRALPTARAMLCTLCMLRSHAVPAAPRAACWWSATAGSCTRRSCAPRGTLPPPACRQGRRLSAPFFYAPPFHHPPRSVRLFLPHRQELFWPLSCSVLYQAKGGTCGPAASWLRGCREV